MNRLSKRYRLSLIVVLSTAQILNSPAITWAQWPAPATSAQKLAKQIDKLEKHLDQYGTVVAKSPDVWGQARLTKYRVEYEKAMSAYRGQFNQTLNGAISRSDEAFLTNALALQAAISGRVATSSRPVVRTVTNTTQQVALGPNGTPLFDAQGKPVLLSSSTQGNQPGTEFDKINTPSPASSDPITAPQFSTSPTLFSSSSNANFQSVEKFADIKDGIAVEPTVLLDQASRYHNHLSELLRINDGDDKADAPGYALHLVRIPVSVLPGEKTREGYGAEVTVIAKPNLHDNLLPETFRGLVINDLVDQFAFPLVDFISTKDAANILAGNAEEPERLELMEELEKIEKAANELISILDSKPASDEDLQTLYNSYVDYLISLINMASNKSLVKKSSELACLFKDLESAGRNLQKLNLLQFPRNKLRDEIDSGSSSEPIARIQKQREFYRRSSSLDPEVKARAEQYFGAIQNRYENFKTAKAKVKEILVAQKKLRQDFEQFSAVRTAAPSQAGARNRRSTLPFPLSQAYDIYGIEELIPLAKLALPIANDSNRKGSVLLVDMQKFLDEEFQAAYELLKDRPDLWQMCDARLHQAVRSKDRASLEALRNAFLVHLGFSQEEQAHSRVLCWAIIVESVLLNERLNEDMEQLAQSKNALHLYSGKLPYYGPNPPVEARQAFNRYVECRWPLHVFALDPVIQEQNIADVFHQRREMQLALSLAFASGRIGAQNFTRMARRMDLDMQTIALNKTAVGFSHGEDTFGWRFTPRMQSPDTECNVKAFSRLAIMGGHNKDSILRDQRLEPGQRECTAIVIMPSFVPYVIFDIRTNWYRLDRPAQKRMNVSNGLDLSKEVTSLRQLTAACVQDAHLYRNDETWRMTRAVEQLERRLPTQTMYAQMPFENSLGGFEFFNHGVSDLAPELKGFFGSPGVLVDGNATTTSAIQLIGDHFSVHETEVVAGNKRLDKSRITILSRQVVVVEIPGNVQTVDNTLDLHVSTPYGVSNRLKIPVSKSSTTAAAETAATKLVQEHVEKKHVDQLAWKEPSAPVLIQLDANRLPKAFHVQGRATLVNQAPSPFDAEVPSVKVRAKVLFQQKGKNPVDARAIAKMDCNKWERNEIVVSEPSAAGKLQGALNEALKQIPLPSDLEKILLVTYAQYDSKVIKVENTFTLDIQFCTTDLCQPECKNALTLEPPISTVSLTPSPEDPGISQVSGISKPVPPTGANNSVGHVRLTPRQATLRPVPAAGK